MLDHPFEEEAIELGALRLRQAGHFLRGEHAGHQRRAVHVHRVRARDAPGPGPRSQRCIILISSSCESSIRSPSIRMSSRVGPRLARRPTISTACAWWPIIPCMNLHVGRGVLNLRQVGRLVGGDDATRLRRARPAGRSARAARRRRSGTRRRRQCRQDQDDPTGPGIADGHIGMSMIHASPETSLAPT